MKFYSVTQVLGRFQDFSDIPARILELAGERGSLVHAACSAHAAGVWVRPLPEDGRGYFESFLGWWGRAVSRVLWVEEEFADPDLGFTGRLDVVVELIDGRVVVVDYKTPAVRGVTWAAQVSAYLHLLNRFYRIAGGAGRVASCMALQLKKNGGPARAFVSDYSDNDFSAFLSALNAVRYFAKG